MLIKRIVFLFIAVVVSFAVGLGFWMMNTDVVLSPAPESEVDADETGGAENLGGAFVESGNENMPDASSYGEKLSDPPEGEAGNQDAGYSPIE